MSKETKENPQQREAREKVKELYDKFQKELSHQNAAATLTLAITMKELVIELVRHSEKDKVNATPKTKNKTVPSPVSGNGKVARSA